MNTPRTVLVTGAARRLGREIALALAGGGWQVAVHYRSSQADAVKTVEDCRTLAGFAQGFEADLDDEAAVHSLLPRVIDAFGQVDAVVNSAALFEQDSAHDFSYAAMQRHWRTNTGAPVLLAQALAVHVVGVAPGLTLVSHLLSDEKFEALHRLSPLGRSSLPQDVAATVRFALENPAITGTTLMVDGGQHLMRFERDFSAM